MPPAILVYAGEHVWESKSGNRAGEARRQEECATGDRSRGGSHESAATYGAEGSARTR